MEDGHSLVVVLESTVSLDDIHAIGLPDVLVEVDMDNEQPTSGKRLVPPHLLAVLQQIVLIGVGIVVDDIGITAFRERHHAVYLHLVVTQFDRVEPSQHHAFMTRITGGYETIAIVIAHAHHIPCIHAKLSR